MLKGGSFSLENESSRDSPFSMTSFFVERHTSFLWNVDVISEHSKDGVRQCAQDKHCTAVFCYPPCLFTVVFCLDNCVTRVQKCFGLFQGGKPLCARATAYDSRFKTQCLISAEK